MNLEKKIINRNFRNSQGKFFIIVGPSGTGKTTLIKHFFKSYSKKFNLFFSISYTTRSPRKNEINGKDYFFISKEKFLHLIRQNFFLEHNYYDNYYYGTSKKQILDLITKNKNVIFDIEDEGAKHIVEIFPEAITIYIRSEKEVILYRLHNRNENSIQSIKYRLKKFELLQKLNFINHCDYVIENPQDNINYAIDKLYKYLEKILLNK